MRMQQNLIFDDIPACQRYLSSKTSVLPPRAMIRLLPLLVPALFIEPIHIHPIDEATISPSINKILCSCSNHRYTRA